MNFTGHMKRHMIQMLPKVVITREIFISFCPLRGGLPETNPHGKATGQPDRPFKFL